RQTDGDRQIGDAHFGLGEELDQPEPRRDSGAGQDFVSATAVGFRSIHCTFMHTTVAGLTAMIWL
ncbi:MAG TPA: hypothetical protein VMS88_03710, partial [Terriglobales bacterium]|nr:hypothetical protein [Terriglobales bacterium]